MVLPHEARRRRAAWRVAAAATAVLAMAGVLSACGGSSKSAGSKGGNGTGGSTTTAPAGTPRHGGTLTVLENSADIGAWPSLDPATDTSGATDDPYMEAIYGDLFEMGPNGKLIPDLATGYTLSTDAQTVTIDLRHGVTFTDGTPFNSAAVKFDWQRIFQTDDCHCSQSFPVTSIDTPDDYTVVMHLSKPFAPIMENFPETAPDWIGSPTALQKMGEKAFALKPVGAGPFEVVSDALSSKLVLTRNPNYWKKGEPYLDGLVFTTVGTDNSAYDAVTSGEDQMEQALTTYSILPTARKTLQVTAAPGPATLDVQLNTSTPPFNDIRARKAIFYASNMKPISQALTGGEGVITQSPSAPGSVFYEPKVPGYLTYDLAKAKALVKQLGGLTVTLQASGTNDGLQVAEALAAQWRQAGIKVNLVQLNTLVAIINAFKTNSYQAIIQGIGGVTPFLNNGGSLVWRVYSKGPYTSVHDPHMDALINEATATADPTKETGLLKQIYAYMAQQAYILMIYAVPVFNIAQRDVHGPGITTGQPFPFWQEIWLGS